MDPIREVLIFNARELPVAGSIDRPMFPSNTVCELMGFRNNHHVTLLTRIPDEHTASATKLGLPACAGLHIDEVGVLKLWSFAELANDRKADEFQEWLFGKGLRELTERYVKRMRSDFLAADSDIRLKVQRVFAEMDAKADQIVYVVTSIDDAKQNLFVVNGARDLDTVKERLNNCTKECSYVCLIVRCEDFAQFLARVKTQIGMYRFSHPTAAVANGSGEQYHLHFDDLKNILLYIANRFREETELRKSLVDKHIRNTSVIAAAIPDPVEVFFVQNS